MRVASKHLVLLFAGVALVHSLACLRQFSKLAFVTAMHARPTASASRSLERRGAVLLPGYRGADPNPLFDPVLAYSTFLGGPQSPGVAGGANVTFADGPGNVYVGGFGNVQATPGVVQPTNCQTCLGFLSKIDASGQSLVFSTYTEGVPVTAIAVDSSGNIYVAGEVPPTTLSGTVSAQILPVPSGVTPFQSSPKGKNIGILKLNSTATVILAATYLGGSGMEQVGGLAVDSGDKLQIVGTTTSNDFPTTQNALQSSLGSSGQNIFVTKLDASLSSVVYSTYLGQNSRASVGNPSNAVVTPSTTGLPAGHAALAGDASNNVYIAGNADAGFPTTVGAVQGSCPTGSCIFVAKIDAAGSSLLYSTYLSAGATGALAYTVAIDGSRNIYVGGTTGAGYPEVNALQPCNQSNGFVSEIDASGALTFSTCLGNGSVLDLVADSSQDVDLIGYSTGLPLKNPIQTHPNPFTDAFVASISPNSNPPSLLFSSYIGSGNEALSFGGVGVDSSRNIYAVGSVYDGAENFPVFNALQPAPAPCSQCGFIESAFLMKISPTDAAAAALSPGALGFTAQQVGMPSSSQSITVFDLGSAALTVSNATATGDFFVQNNCGTVSPAGGNCTIQVTFTPTATGTRTGTLTITDSASGSPRTVELSGQGAVATLNVAPGSLSFASQAIGSTSPAQTITLTNPGPLGVQIARIATTGEFTETNNCGAAITINTNCVVNVFYTPTVAGNQTGTLTITDSATDSPQTVSLVGTGTNDFSMAASTSSATVAAGATATFSLAATPAAGFSGNVNFACTGAPASSTCTVSPNPLTLTTGGLGEFSVAVTTTARTTAQLGKSQSFSGAARLEPTGLLGSLLLGVVLLPVGLGRKGSRKRMLMLVSLALLSVAGFGCGGGGGSTTSVTGTPSGTYTLTVTGSSGTVTQTVTLSLTVQ